MKDDDVHEWNVLLVKDVQEIDRSPLAALQAAAAVSRIEIQVWSKTIRGAVIKAENKMKKEPEGEWMIKSVWWLDPRNTSWRQNENASGETSTGSR